MPGGAAGQQRRLPVWAAWAQRSGGPAHLVKLDALYRWTRDDGLATAAAPGSLHRESPPFCVGAFLLAAAELAGLTRPVRLPRGAL